MLNIKFKFPTGVVTIFNLQALGMFAYTIVAALLTLYTTEKLGFGDNHAFAITAAFYGLVFATSVPGGYIAENYWGYKKAFVISIILAGLGTLAMMLPTKPMLYLGLGLFLIGNGIFVPCIYVMLGQLFKKDDPKRESAFTLSYIGMNLGGFIAGIISGNLTNLMGYSYVFLLATLITLSMFFFVPYFYKQLPTQSFQFFQKSLGYVFLIIILGITILGVMFASYCNLLLLIFGLYCIAYMLFLIFKTTKAKVKQNLIIFTVLFISSTVFWALSALSYSALTLFAKNNVHRVLFGYAVPTADFSGLNPLYIICFGMLVSYLWNKNKKLQQVNMSLIKFAVGLLLAAFGFSLLIIGLKFSNQQGLVSIWWLIFSYLFQSFGELSIGPVGYAIVAKLVAENIEGRMMGIWQMASGIGGALSYYFAKLSTATVSGIQASDHQYIIAFGTFSTICILSALILVIAYFFLKIRVSRQSI